MGQGAWGMVYYSAGVGTCACTLRRHAPCPLPHAIKRYTVLSMSELVLLIAHWQQNLCNIISFDLSVEKW